jgi:hypothetical protein
VKAVHSLSIHLTSTRAQLLSSAVPLQSFTLAIRLSSDGPDWKKQSCNPATHADDAQDTSYASSNINRKQVLGTFFLRIASSNQLDSADRWPSGLRRQLKVISSGYINNRWSERAWVQIPLCSTYLLPPVYHISVSVASVFFFITERLCNVASNDFRQLGRFYMDIQSHACLL